MITNKAKIIAQGLAKITTKPLNLAASGGPAYTTDGTVWQGHTEVKITPKQTTTKLASGNDPDWMTLKGPVTADVEIKFFDIDVVDLAELIPCDSDACSVSFGDKATPKYLGIDVETTSIGEDGTENKVDLVLYKTEFEIPEISRKTVSEDDVALADVTLKGKATPIYYTSSGAKKAVTLKIAKGASSDLLVYPTST